MTLSWQITRMTGKPSFAGSWRLTRYWSVTFSIKPFICFRNKSHFLLFSKIKELFAKLLQKIENLLNFSWRSLLKRLWLPQLCSAVLRSCSSFIDNVNLRSGLRFYVIKIKQTLGCLIRETEDSSEFLNISWKLYTVLYGETSFSLRSILAGIFV